MVMCNSVLSSSLGTSFELVQIPTADAHVSLMFCHAGIEALDVSSAWAILGGVV